jgi:hypothetical protein
MLPPLPQLEGTPQNTFFGNLCELYQSSFPFPRHRNTQHPLKLNKKESYFRIMCVMDFYCIPPKEGKEMENPIKHTCLRMLRFDVEIGGELEDLVRSLLT